MNYNMNLPKHPSVHRVRGVVLVFAYCTLCNMDQGDGRADWEQSNHWVLRRLFV
jgi:hypothetical protein